MRVVITKVDRKELKDGDMVKFRTHDGKEVIAIYKKEEVVNIRSYWGGERSGFTEYLIPISGADSFWSARENPYYIGDFDGTLEILIPAEIFSRPNRKDDNER